MTKTYTESSAMSFESVQSVFSQLGKEKKNIKDNRAKGK